jgi:hypothetical protein
MVFKFVPNGRCPGLYRKETLPLRIPPPKEVLELFNQHRFFFGRFVMKNCIFHLIVTLCVMVIIGCADENHNSALAPDGGPDISTDVMGKQHNELLSLGFENLVSLFGRQNLVNQLAFPRASISEEEVTAGIYKLAYANAAPEQRARAINEAANTLLSRYGQQEMTLEQSENCVQLGRDRAIRNMNGHQTPHKLAWEALKNETQPNNVASYEYFTLWLSTRMDGSTAQEAYQQVLLKYGAPAPDSKLAIFLDVLLHSDAFWSELYPDSDSELSTCAELTALGWKKFFKYVILTVTDAGSASLTGAGYGSVGGPGGAVGGAIVGAIVGGLCSWGANDIIYN